MVSCHDHGRKERKHGREAVGGGSGKKEGRAGAVYRCTEGSHAGDRYNRRGMRMSKVEDVAGNEDAGDG